MRRPRFERSSRVRTAGDSRFSRRNGSHHAFSLGLFMTVMGGVSMALMWGMQPVYYQMSLIVRKLTLRTNREPSGSVISPPRWKVSVL